LDIVARRDDTSLVETAVELDDNLAVSVVIDFLEFTDVSVLLHDVEEFDNDLRTWSNEDLALSSLFGVADALQRVVENGSLDHGRGCREVYGFKSGDEILKSKRSRT